MQTAKVGAEKCLSNKNMNNSSAYPHYLLLI